MTGTGWRSKFDGVPGRVGSKQKDEIQRWSVNPVQLNLDLCVCVCDCVCLILRWM